MKRLIAISALIASAAWAAPHVVVEMKSLGYAPQRVEITPGQSVVWKNVAYTEHSAIADDATPTFDTGMIAPGKTSKAISFTKAGEYAYHRSLHGKSMSGVVVVKASAK